ncbi:MAG TPA: tetratricopeptide repeat protein [Casimicrobiaceae bacterium]|nr:tetratricopeptide repeat protein [Casimicrobiaceae bacterium]
MRAAAFEDPRGANVASATEPSAAAVRRELESILASETFREAQLLRRFLHYSVEQTLLGRGRGLKESRLGIEVFGRDSSFDPRLDPVVRMAARRLRSKLAEYYETEGCRNALRIDMPKGAYATRFAAVRLSPRLATHASAQTTIRSVAVLPFQNLSGDASQEYLADGITEGLITDLAQIRALRVISRTSTWTYKGTGKNLPQIARELNVDAVVEGSVVRVDNRVRVCAQLIDAASDTHLWAQSYDAELRDLLGLQKRVVQTIVQHVGVQLTSREQMRIGTVRLINPDAYEAYLLGRYHWNKRTPAAMSKSLELFDTATRIDPNAAEAYAAAASAYVTLLASENFPPREVEAKARAAAEKAISLDDALAEPHAALCVINAAEEYDWPGSDEEFEKAVERDPNFAPAHHWHGYMLMVRGMVDEACEEMRKALRLDPLNVTIRIAMAGPLNYSGRYEEALQQTRKQFELEPYSFYALCGSAECYSNMDRFDEAKGAYQDALVVSPGNPNVMARLCYVLGKAGQRAEALKLLRELRQSRQGKYWSAGLESWAYAGVGDKSRALDALERAYEDRSYTVLHMRERFYDSLRAEPRFKALAKATGLG